MDKKEKETKLAVLKRKINLLRKQLDSAEKDYDLLEFELKQYLKNGSWYRYKGMDCIIYFIGFNKLETKDDYGRIIPDALRYCLSGLNEGTVVSRIIRLGSDTFVGCEPITEKEAKNYLNTHFKRLLTLGENLSKQLKGE